MPSIALAVLGVALMAAPGLLGYGDPAASIHHVIGPIVAALGVVSASEVTRPVRRALLPVGLGLAIAPLLAGHPGLAAPISVVAGLVIAALAVVPMSTADRFGGGWTAVLDRDRLGSDHPADR